MSLVVFTLLGLLQGLKPCDWVGLVVKSGSVEIS